MFKRKLKEVEGITLIALVITIIVLLILVGISIAMLTGENGILTQAQSAKEKTTKAEEEEKIKMAVMGSSISNDGLVEMIEETSFKNELKNQFGNQELDVVVNGDGSFIVTVKDTNRKYYVNDDKTVINSDNIIEIGTAEELANFRDDVNNGNSYEGKAVLLTSDLILNGEWESIGYYEQSQELEIPKSEDNKPFCGIFDGSNHTINNIQINNEKKGQGLFGLVTEGSIRNVVLGENSTITAGIRSGGIIGCLNGLNGNVYNCINYAKINTESGAGIVGILIGKHIISNCKNYGDIKGMGGIVGTSNGIGGWADEVDDYMHKIIKCGNYGNVTRETGNYCGGIAGYFNGEIEACFNKAEIKSNGRYSGGIVGGIYGRVINCYNKSNISGGARVGGIIRKC